MATVIDWIKRAATRRSLDNRTGDAASAAAAHAPAAANDVALRYTNLGEIARGGMGAIVKVYDREIRRELVMKVFDPQDGKVDDARVGLFVEEAQITGQLDHPNICPVHDVGADSAGTRFFTMKMVRGRTLADIVHDVAYDPMDPRALRAAVEVVLKVCDALAFSHAKGVVHRDLKPENVMVGDFGQVYLMDFGVAKLKMPAAPTGEARATVQSVPFGNLLEPLTVGPVADDDASERGIGGQGVEQQLVPLRAVEPPDRQHEVVVALGPVGQLLRRMGHHLRRDPGRALESLGDVP